MQILSAISRSYKAGMLRKGNGPARDWVGRLVRLRASAATSSETRGKVAGG